MEPQPDENRQGSEAGIPLGEIGRRHRGRMAAAELEPDECQLRPAPRPPDRCLLKVCKQGDPCIVQVRATRIGISQRLAERILVVPAESE